jgi:UDP-N-acetylmuramyl pentapeptide phosphotransferase/UDP-N-acetylglucosamine-1-phosphate transferase
MGQSLFQPTLIVRIAAPLVAFCVTALLLRLLLLPRTRQWFLDHPNQRSLHQSPVPRTGGLGVVAGVLAGGGIAGAAGLALALTAGLMLLSLLDDWRGLTAGVRLLGHLAAAILFMLAGLDGVGWLEVPLFVLGIGWMTNLYNFMDGADGLAGGMGVFGFGAYACAAWLAAQEPLALACASVAASCAAFLLFNFPPARMFLGDAGSIPLGFLAAVLGLSGWEAGIWPLWFPPLVFAPFVADASVTLLRRSLNGEKVWQPHRSHYYQRQVLMGWNHRRLASLEYALMLLTSVVALCTLYVEGPARLAALATLAMAYIGVGLSIDLPWRSHKGTRA